MPPLPRRPSVAARVDDRRRRVQDGAEPLGLGPGVDVAAQRLAGVHSNRERTDHDR